MSNNDKDRDSWAAPTQQEARGPIMWHGRRDHQRSVVTDRAALYQIVIIVYRQPSAPPDP
jgi:hypothetical protein